jgi:multidrug efflux pump
MKKVTEEVRERLLRVPGVEKADLIAPQEEQIAVEISDTRLARFGLPMVTVIDALRRQNNILPAGEADIGSERVFMRVNMGLDTVEHIRSLQFEVSGHLLTLGDIAEVTRTYVDPPRFTMRFKGHGAIGLGVVMARNGNMLDLGKALADAMVEIKAHLPAGIEVAQVADQPKVVERSINQFLSSLVEALAIVMLISFLSLGWRSGIVVALAVPLVLALTLMAMFILGINLHKISLGALIIALGLLVDDAIIAVEMMMVKMEQGWDRAMACAYAYSSTAFPMLSGTIVTAAGFVPVGLARSSAGEYTNAIFWVVALSLLISWVVAVVFTPYLGNLLLPEPRQAVWREDVYAKRGYRVLRRMVVACIRMRWLTIGITAAAFVAALIGFGSVQQQFFPSANRPELMVDLRLAEGSSFDATAAEVRKMEALLAKDSRVEHWVAYTGGGSPRFYMSLDQQLQNANFAQLVVMTKGIKEREAVLQAIEACAETDFPAARVRVSRLENGPSVGYPVQFRVMGGDPVQLRKYAYEVRRIMQANPHLANVHLDWDELAKSVSFEVDTSKARILGISRDDLSNALRIMVEGFPVTQYREGRELINIVIRAIPEERKNLAQIGDLNIRTARGAIVPLSQIATVHYDLEEPILRRRDRQTTITVRADVVDGIQAPVVSQEVDSQLEALRARLPDGYRIGMGGVIEESAKGVDSIVALVPLMVLIMAATLMIQLQKFSLVFMVFLTAPLGLIGVTGALLASNLPFGFVAMQGVIALAGIIMRNSVILVDQIEQDIRAGLPQWDAVVEATVRRTRPILLTAATAILAMIPLTQSIFWKPMAVAIMGGLTCATFLTIFFLPALYAAWFRVRSPSKERVASVPISLDARWVPQQGD